jgi:prolyl 4-hydroxylase
MFFRRGQDEVIKSVEDRIAAYSMVPADHGEGIQVLHYLKGQKYEAHFDYFHDQLNIQNGGQRVATVLLYLCELVRDSHSRVR